MTSQVQISVVVPVYKDWDKLQGLLAALEAQTLERSRFEVILVANDPTPPPEAPSCNLDLTLLHCPTPGSYAARNVGWPKARAPHIVFTDADCLPVPEWLEAMLSAADQSPQSLIAGDVKVSVPQAPDKQTPSSDYDVLLGLPQKTYVSRGYAVTANLCVPREVLERLNGFDDKRFSGGDAELCFAAKRAGFDLLLSEEALVYHPARASFAEHYSKLQRVRGGQLASGPLKRRLKYAVRTMVPPIRRSIKVVCAPEPIKMKLRGLMVLYALWLAGFAESLRLLVGGKPVR